LSTGVVSVINIAIAEDDMQQQKVIKEHLERYSAENAQQVACQFFSDGFQLLENYTVGKFDILLLDIQMQHIDGMKAAQEIRMIDEAVLIIFITNLAHYAIQGYSVRAFDFIIKPIDHELFERKINNAVQVIKRNQRDKVSFKVHNGRIGLDRAAIMYFEIFARKITIHTDTGSYQINDTLKNIEQIIDDARFFRCHAGFLVNISHVKFVGKTSAKIGNAEVPISKHRRKEFLEAIANGMGREI
jgi:DNA-binding LytR/AlgR family response regulator